MIFLVLRPFTHPKVEFWILFRIECKIKRVIYSIYCNSHWLSHVNKIFCRVTYRFPSVITRLHEKYARAFNKRVKIPSGVMRSVKYPREKFSINTARDDLLTQKHGELFWGAALKKLVNYERTQHRNWIFKRHPEFFRLFPSSRPSRTISSPSFFLSPFFLFLFSGTKVDQICIRGRLPKSKTNSASGLN